MVPLLVSMTELNLHLKSSKHKKQRAPTRSGGGCCWFWLLPPAVAATCELLLAFVGLAGASRGLFLSTARER